MEINPNIQEKRNIEEIKVFEKVDLVYRIQKTLPNLVVGGSLAAYLLGLKYKEPLDIDLFTEEVTIEEFLDCLNQNRIPVREYEKSLKVNTLWMNNEFKMNIEYGYSVKINSYQYFDFKRIKIYPPYSLKTETVMWKGRNIIVESREILEQGIRSFQNYCLDLGATHIMEGKYKNIDKVFPNRKQII